MILNNKKKNISIKKVKDFKEKIEFNKVLDLDDRDNVIISMLQKNPEISQQDIAKKLKLSQPSVSARIKKLEEKGIIQNVSGINFKKINLFFAKVDINSTDSNSIIKDFENCPFFINALITSGRYNLCIFFMAPNIKRLEGIINHHLRNNPKVKDIEMNIIITTAKDFIHPLNIDYENRFQVDCNQDCMNLKE